MVQVKQDVVKRRPVTRGMTSKRRPVTKGPVATQNPDPPNSPIAADDKLKWKLKSPMGASTASAPVAPVQQPPPVVAPVQQPPPAVAPVGDDNVTALVYAVLNNHQDVVSALLLRGVLYQRRPHP